MKITPLGKRVLVQRDNVAGKTAGGIYMTNQEPSVFGTILEIGDDKSITLKQSDRVLLPKGGGVPIKISEDYEVEMFPLENIYALITDEK